MILILFGDSLQNELRSGLIQEVQMLRIVPIRQSITLFLSVKSALFESRLRKICCLRSQSLSENEPKTLKAFASRAKSFLAFWVFLLTVCIAASNVFAQETPSTDPTDAPAAEVADAVPTHSNVEPVHWIPDQRVLVNAPPTTIDFDEVAALFCDSAAFDGAPGKYKPEDVAFSIVQAPSIVEAEFNGKELLLKWNQDAVGKGRVVVKAAVDDETARPSFVTFNVESWEPNYWTIFAATLGGLGLFLFGMKRMSDGLQAIAGARMRRLISMFTNNRFLGIGVGFLTTAVVQSSSATTVMTLSFVDSGLMTLKQAIAVIMGTNIGTTATGWLLTLKLGSLGLPITGAAALVAIFAKREKIRDYAMFTLGLGLVFFGLQTMSAGLSPLPEIPEFTNFMSKFEANSIWGALKCVFVGCVTTILVQSSSATVAITMTLVSLGAFGLDSAAALVLGENIGTTSTALISSINSTPNGKRSAYFHSLFNVIGVAWVLCIFFPVLLPFVNSLGDSLHFDDAAKVALTHSTFNIVNTIVFVPFVGVCARFLMKHVKDKTNDVAKQNQSVTGLSSFHNDAPFLAIERSRLEVRRMFVECIELFDVLKAAHKSGFADNALNEKAFELEEKLDVQQDETIEFISKLTTRTFSNDLAASAREQIRVAEELESLSDQMISILKSNLKLKASDTATPRIISENFDRFLDDAANSLKFLDDSFAVHKHHQVANVLSERRDAFVSTVKKTQSELQETMFQDQLQPNAIIAVDFQLSVWRRVYERLLNISEAIEKPGVLEGKVIA